MKWAALIAWIVTAGGGFVLLTIWLARGGMQQQGGAGNRVLPGELDRVVPLQGLDQAEIGQKEPAFRCKQNIGRLDIAVNNSASVREIERGSQLFKIINDFWEK